MHKLCMIFLVLLYVAALMSCGDGEDSPDSAVVVRPAEMDKSTQSIINALGPEAHLFDVSAPSGLLTLEYRIFEDDTRITTLSSPISLAEKAEFTALISRTVFEDKPDINITFSIGSVGDSGFSTVKTGNTYRNDYATSVRVSESNEVKISKGETAVLYYRAFRRQGSISAVAFIAKQKRAADADIKAFAKEVDRLEIVLLYR